MPETKDLADILQARNVNGRYDDIIERARLNGYHDYKFDVIPGHPEYGECVCPKMQLVHDLSKFPELEDIRIKVMAGNYDEKADEEDKARMREELNAEGAPPELLKAMGL